MMSWVTLRLYLTQVVLSGLMKLHLMLQQLEQGKSCLTCCVASSAMF